MAAVQCAHCHDPTRKGVSESRPNSGSFFGFSIVVASSGRIPRPQAGSGTCSGAQCWGLELCSAYSRCSINICRMTKGIMPASGCQRAPREHGRWKENSWTPATPYISGIFSESDRGPLGRHLSQLSSRHCFTLERQPQPSSSSPMLFFHWNHLSASTPPAAPPCLT
ncbi:PREDICTED: LOW QUALITY PROTEIN: uncharacterized protein C22orf24 homolog [Lipotes vexillifer]|uniref:LOW QUALITY PROTEIN: uncharacterized protein C22orf24 homolog n=1 Tax=Lipotes vexillifer TaxID=118797 RepID=A0A340YHJ9_LIPVE|nr:PREDICTED: LOW QUALITY PROTEIN: uncharacterized protein C22orf24 homolog [Lipotes vexillifer]